MHTKVLKINVKNPQISKIRQAAKMIKQGKLVVFPTETVYGLGADALNAAAVKRIFKAKGRPADNPLIIHIHRKDDLGFLVKNVPNVAPRLVERFWPGPLTIVLRKSAIVPKIVTWGLDTVAVRMPKSKISRLLIKESGTPIAAPSANFAGRPSPTLAKHVLEDLSGRINLVIDGGQTKIGIESTVIDLTGKTPILLRPGGITLEQLRKTIGKVNIHPILRGKKSKSAHRSPGMKYRHYSPNAKIILVEGPKSKVNSEITRLLKSIKKQQKRIGVMTTEGDFAQKADLVKYVGDSYDEIATNLFKAFREFDSKKIDVVIAQGISRKGLGLGIMNRLSKASYRRIRV